MSITEVSIIYHVGLVFALLWLLSSFNCCHPIAYFVSLIYLYQVHDRYIMRLRRKLQFEERRQANQRRVLSDSESVRWLNFAVEKMWPICMEQIVSQKVLLPIIPWFLEKFKPWTAKKALVQHLYMGRNPPLFTEMRVLPQTTDDDHLVLQIGMNFLTADDMSAILAVKLRKRLGFGMWAKLHLTGMHVEGKVLVGVKFLRRWPFIGRLRVCFVEPPYFQMTVKPISTHGLDVTELPGIAGWLDKLLGIAFEQTLVEPNMLVVDVEKFASPGAEGWFSIDEKEPLAYAKVEVIEASDMKPSDLNGLADPYVKGQLGPYRFKTTIQRKTLAPKWHEEFKIPICSWESTNVLNIGVRDKDHLFDDTLGDCSVSIGDLRDGQRHDMWLPLRNIKVGRLHLAITILEANGKEVNLSCNLEMLSKGDRDSITDEVADCGSSSTSSEKSGKMTDKFEPVDIEGQEGAGIWVYRPGTDVQQTWEPRKGKTRRLDNQIQKESNDYTGSFDGQAACNHETIDADINKSRPLDPVRTGLHKLGSVFGRNSRTEDQFGSSSEVLPSPNANIKAVNESKIGVKLIVEDSLAEPASAKVPITEGSSSADGSSPESPSKLNMKEKAKSFIKHAGKNARNLKHVFSGKGLRSRGKRSGTLPIDRDISIVPDSSDEDSLPSSDHTSQTETDPVVINLVLSRPNSPSKPKESGNGSCPKETLNDSSSPIETVVQRGSEVSVVNSKSLEDKVGKETLNNSPSSKETIVQTGSEAPVVHSKSFKDKVGSEAVEMAEHE